MSLRELERVLERIESRSLCGQCPLKHSKPLLFKLDREVSVAVITEGPNREDLR